MMKYYLIACSLLCSALYYLIFFEIHPYWEAVKMNDIQKQNLTRNREMQIQPDLADTIIDHAALSKNLLALLETSLFKHGITIKKMNIDPDSLKIDMEIQAQLQNLNHFLIELVTREINFEMKYFNYIAIKQKLSIGLSVLSYPRKPRKVILHALPMCGSSKNVKSLHEQFDFPVREFEIVGYLKKGSKAYAIVGLPSQRKILITEDDKIGQEHASIMKIKKGSVEAVFPNGDKIKLEKNQNKKT